MGARSYRLHATVEGHVQGVGFRYFVMDLAVLYKVTGWVRNTHEGNVEVLAEGDREDLELMLDKLRKGPRSGFVTNVSYQWEPASNQFTSFSVKQTA